MSEMSNKFKSFQSASSFTRASARHLLELYYGKNDSLQDSLLLVTPIKPERLESSKFINVSEIKQSSGRYLLMFSLTDNVFSDVFYSFCSDIINTTENIKDIDFGTSFICQRYLKWQEMLKKKPSVLLTYNEIKGLIGELYFLKEYLSKKTGYEQALSAWTGPEMTKQDFRLEDCWYEIKATSTSAESITISSIEQLDTDSKGSLVIEYLNKTSKEDNERINLNLIINLIKQDINNFYIESKLDNILLKKGYFYDESYDDINFVFVKSEMYQVEGDFPCIKRSCIPDSVKDAKYELRIGSLSEYKEVEDGVR